MGQTIPKTPPAASNCVNNTLWYNDGENVDFLSKSKLNQLCKAFVQKCDKKSFNNNSHNSSQFKEVLNKNIKSNRQQQTPSNSIDLSEINEYLLANTCSKRISVKEKLVWAFKLYDVDRLGHIDFRKFLSMVKVISHVLKAKDKDNNNESNKTKKKLFLANEGEIQSDSERVFQRLDKDGDGKISLEEFLQITEIFPQLNNILSVSNKR